jgi:hypothetical protein
MLYSGDTLLPFIPISTLLKKLKFKTEVDVGEYDFYRADA